MRLFLKKLPLLLLVLWGTIAFAQTDIEKAHQLGQQAVELEDNGNFGGALKILDQAQKLDPISIAYPYEMSYCYYGMKDYQKAIDQLTKLTTYRDCDAKVYQLLGNSYDLIGQNAKAIEIYEAGLKVFPNSGELYLECSVIQMGKNDYHKALDLSLKGIEVAPQFPSNYYWASKILCNSDEKVQGVLYAEAFMNLERNSKRTPEISKLLFDTYKSSVSFISPNKASVNFSKAEIVVNSKADLKNFKLPFRLVYPLIFLISVGADTAINITTLNGITQRFVETYYQRGNDKDYPNKVIDYQNQVLKAGHMEAYNYWLLMKGDETTFNNWYAANKDKWQNFVNWFKDNPINLSNTGK